MKPALHLLHLNKQPILQQLQLEEALLRADRRNWCIFNEGSPDAIVMGISGKPHELINKKKFRQNPIPVIRRFSGGGCVRIDQDTLFVSLIFNRECAPVQPYPRHILCWTRELYAPLFNSEKFCVRENDYVFGSDKFGGNAQYLVKDRWLHHSSILWDFCKDKMEYLLLPKMRPDYRNNRPHHEFLCTLKPLFESRHHFWQQLQKSLSQHFELHPTPLHQAQIIQKKPHRKATQLIEFEKLVSNCINSYTVDCAKAPAVRRSQKG